MNKLANFRLHWCGIYDNLKRAHKRKEKAKTEFFFLSENGFSLIHGEMRKDVINTESRE